MDTPVAVGDFGPAGWFRQWAALEAEAVSLYTYECRLIPGLLQTEAYARRLFVNQLPPLGDEQIEAHGPLQLLETPDHRWLGYCEGQEGGQLTPGSEVVSTLHMRYARTRSQALSLEDSLGLLRQMRGAV